MIILSHYFYLSDFSGSQTRLSGRALTPQEILTTANAFARGEISSTSGRQKTPPPFELDPPQDGAETAETITSNPWQTDENDREVLDSPALKGNTYSCLLLSIT